jgi:hypothetical protein
MVFSKKSALAKAAVLSALIGTSTMVHAQEVRLNYDRLSSLEEPVAFSVGDVTVEVSGVADIPVVAQDNKITAADDVNLGFVGNFEVTAETQLANRWTVGAAYFGEYSTDVFNGGDDYSDNVAGFIGTSFGTVLGGNVNGQVRELTRRARGVGNGFLAFDDFYGSLDRWGGAYIGRFGPSVVSAVVDENGDFELGAQFQRPIGERDYRFTARVRRSSFVAADGLTEFNSTGAGLVGEFVYGSSLYDLGVGYERMTSQAVGANRWFLSTGAQTQLGPLLLSAEGHYGQAAGDDEIAAAFGASYAIARGLSLNSGINYENAKIEAGGIDLVQTEQITAVGSVRFSF